MWFKQYLMTAVGVTTRATVRNRRVKLLTAVTQLHYHCTRGNIGNNNNLLYARV